MSGGREWETDEEARSGSLIEEKMFKKKGTEENDRNHLKVKMYKE